MSNQLIISAYGSHNAAIVSYHNGKFTVVEVERWLNKKNSGLTEYLPCANPQLVFDEITEYLLKEAGRTDVDVYISSHLHSIIPKFSYREHVNIGHHDAHAAAAFYQSPFNESLVISFDGGGDGDFFNVYLASREHGIRLLEKLPNDLGFPYMLMGEYLSDITREPLYIGNLVYSGKIMGLCSYGTVNQDWLPYFKQYYRQFVYNSSSYIGGLETKPTAVNALFSSIGLFENFDLDSTRFEGQVAWDLAATSQRAFEDVFLELANKWLQAYKHLPLCISGGCGLNVLLNARLLGIKQGNVFVPPNTSDCGIATGALLHHLAPTEQVDLTYCGLPILDEHNLSSIVQDTNKYTVVDNVTVAELARYIANNHIVGVIQGRAEHGSRALGNRSIICNPAAGMKDVLNHKVKHREWYRPFAPIVKAEDANKYFHYDYNVESRHMTFVANVREEYKTVVPAITHMDGTARLQTVTRDQNTLIYDLITEFEKHTGYGVVLNTSFNVNGKPILSTLTDAFEILDNTELDAVFYKDKLITKPAGAHKFLNLRNQ